MTLQPDLLAGEVVVVTSGMARIAVVLGRLGARVLATGPGADAFRVPEGVDVAAEELDVTNKPGVQEVINGVERLDILVNCAGVIRRGEEHQVCVFEKVLAANITGTRDVQRRASKTEGEQWLHHKHRVHAQLLRWRLGVQSFTCARSAAESLRQSEPLLLCYRRKAHEYG
jgi:NAD(P)-dependent dehydrogenase (short-subunit alcohol dehydrogenase family)